MANPIFQALGGAMGGGMNINPMQMLSQLKSNPFGMLRKAGFNVPENINNPQAIIQHLMNSGQLTQQQLTKAQQAAQNFGVK